MKALKRSLGITSGDQDDENDVVKAVKAGPIDPRFIRELECIEQGSGIENVTEFCRRVSGHRGHAELQHRGCRCLIRHSAYFVSPENIVTDVLGIEIAQCVLGALVSHKANHKLVADLIRLVSIIGTHAQIRIHLSKMKGVKRILSAMDRFPNLVEVGTAGGMDKVLKAMDCHPSHAALQARACLCLRNLATIPSNQLAIAQKGGIDRVVRALKTHLLNAELASEACRCFANIGRNAQTQDVLADLGGIQVVIATMDAHKENAVVLEQAVLALCNIGFLYRHVQVLLDKFANRNETPDPSPVSSERGALRTEEGTIIVMSVGGEAQLTQGMAPGSLRTANLVTDKMPQLNLVRRQWSSPPSSHSPASPRASAASAARTPPPSTGSTDDRNAEDLVPVKSMGKVTPGGGVTITPSVPEWAETIDSPDGEEGENPKGLC